MMMCDQRGDSCILREYDIMCFSDVSIQMKNYSRQLMSERNTYYLFDLSNKSS